MTWLVSCSHPQKEELAATAARIFRVLLPDWFFLALMFQVWTHHNRVFPQCGKSCSNPILHTGACMRLRVLRLAPCPGVSLWGLECGQHTEELEFHLQACVRVSWDPQGPHWRDHGSARSTHTFWNSEGQTQGPAHPPWDLGFSLRPAPALHEPFMSPSLGCLICAWGCWDLLACLWGRD